jgi:anti-sigma-K factor RskA
MAERYRSHEELQAELAEYALGTLAAERRLILEAHLPGCAECRAILADYSQVVELYPLSVALQEPPPGALERLIERAHDPLDLVELPQRLYAPRRPRSRSGALWAGFAALAAIIVALLAWNLWLQFGTDDPDVFDDGAAVIVPLAGSADAEGATAHLVFDAEWKNCTLVASGLPALDPDRAYQFWFARADGTRFSGGVFRPNERGQIAIELELPEDPFAYERVGVTEEPSGGSPGPTGRNVLGGRLYVQR